VTAAALHLLGEAPPAQMRDLEVLLVGDVLVLKRDQVALSLQVGVGLGAACAAQRHGRSKRINARAHNPSAVCARFRAFFFLRHSAPTASILSH
jgi:hypothetical protein